MTHNVGCRIKRKKLKPGIGTNRIGEGYETFCVTEDSMIMTGQTKCSKTWINENLYPSLMSLNEVKYLDRYRNVYTIA